MESKYSRDLSAAVDELPVSAITVEITKLSIAPGDVLVVTLKHAPTERQVEAIRAQAAKVLPDGVKVVVHGPDVKLSVVTQTHARPRPVIPQPSPGR